VVAALAPRDDGQYVDGTFGAGGTSAAILAAARCRVIGIDRDPDAIRAGQALAAAHGDRLTLVPGRFGDLAALVAGLAPDGLDGIALDLGVSSMQLDQPARGFSFQTDGPLDMRMGPTGPSAADVVNGESEQRLADILFRLGGERRSRRIARAIVEARAKAPITRTLELAALIEAVVPGGRIHPATRSFQALRIHVNDELAELARGLAAAERLLRPAGRLCVISFHSLEDRLVKTFLKRRAGAEGGPSRHRPPRSGEREPSFDLVRRRALKPTAAEIAANPRARSARLRAAIRRAAPAWPADDILAAAA